MTTRRKKKKPSTARKRRKSTRRSAPRIPLLRIGVGFALLIGIVCGAGALLWHYVPPARPPSQVAQSPTPKAKSKPPQVVRKKSAPTKPVYEVFPTKAITRRASKPAPAAAAAPGGRPRVAIIIDDIGYDRQLLHQFLALDIPLTFAVLPESPFHQSIVKEIRARGREMMLHQPMEPEEYPRVKPGPGALLASMSPDELITQLNRNLDALPGVKGVNNHMGSRLTAESGRMYQVFSVLKERGLFFVDSRSTVATVCRPSARMFQVPFAERDVFLDHLQDAGFVRQQFREVLREAAKNGQAVAIGHPYPVTVQIFREFLPTIKKRVRLVSASEIVRVES